MSEIDHETLAFAHKLADAAGAVIRPYFRRGLDVDDKGAAKGQDFDPVTAADRGAEEALRKMIRAERPKDAILGEEYGATDGTSGRRWVLDPVDGTRAFITGHHMWGTLIALEEGGKRVLGIIDQPVLRERFIGYPGTAELITPEDSAPLKTRDCARLSEAIVTTTHPWNYFDDAEEAGFVRVASAARMSRFGGDCYGYALLAAGYTDLVIESGLRPWDVAALVPVVENAGGVVTDWQGNALGTEASHFAIIAAGDRRVHAEAVKLLNA
jgi:histidinol phosphatase-like enzyme (inositol monophosphatase family)